MRHEWAENSQILARGTVFAEVQVRSVRPEWSGLSQVWDCSGDAKYSNCWMGMKQGADGIVIVADPEKHNGDDIVPW